MAQDDKIMDDPLQELTLKMTTDKEVVNILLEVLAAHGVRHAVCSPGSRDIPLLLGLEGSNSIDYRMVTDERSAGFIALGMSISSNSPVMLVCTSGTAVLNYGPAVAEAYYQGRPLIVVSADRPAQWIDQDDSQTIQQYEILRNVVKKSYDISDIDLSSEDGRWYAERIFNDAMLVASAGKKGPVHINIRFHTPLNVTRPATPPSVRVIDRLEVLGAPDRNVIKRLAALAVDRRILLVAGFMQPNAKTNEAVNKFRRHPNVVVMAETISNLHLPGVDYAIDTLLHDTKPEAPQLIISIGGALVSRMLKEYLRKLPDKDNLLHWSVGYNHTTVDCFRSLTSTIECDPGVFIRQLSAEMAHIVRKRCFNSLFSDYAHKINTARAEAKEKLYKRVLECGWSEAMAFKTLLHTIPQSDNVCLSNGTPIRYTQLFTDRLQHAQYCNRGVSGIDGSTSTAVGNAIGYKGRTWLITGDMSLAYDLAGLREAELNDARLHVIVINNGGGGIFRFIPASRSLAILDKTLCRDENPDIAKTAEIYGFEYLLAKSKSTLEQAAQKMRQSSHRCLLEIKADPRKSAQILIDLLKS